MAGIMTPSLCVITVNHGRPKILNLWCEGIKRLREDVGWFHAVCVSGAEDKATCDKYSVVHITKENKPVTEKFNKACEYAKTLGVDYVMILGSDDLVSSETMRKILADMTRGYDLIGVANIFFYSTDGPKRGQLVQLHGTRILGVAKTISAEVMNGVGWRPWVKAKNYGMDSVASQAIAPFVKSTMILRNQKVFDCKSKDNLNKFSLWSSKFKPEDPNIFWNSIGEGEKRILSTICNEKSIQ